MNVIPLVPDAAVAPSVAVHAPGGFASILDGMASTLADATRAEDAFASGSGSLVHAVYERARADVAVSVAAAAAGRVVQSVQSLLNMQV